MPLPDAIDQADLSQAVAALENPTFVMTLANFAGKPVEFAMKQLPAQATDSINAIATSALNRALGVALSTIGVQERGPARWLHKGAVAISGGVGGIFGLAGAAIEIPISTTVMLRSIAAIARAEGENLQDVEARLACLEVFALGRGGSAEKSSATDSAYFLTRTALARAVAQAAAFVAERGVAEKGAPVLVQLVAAIAKRFAPVIAEKFAAESIPVLGALGGATLNVLFIDHYQRMAHGHFTIRRLERRYGSERVQQEYEQLLRQPPSPPGSPGDPTL